MNRIRQHITAVFLAIAILFTSNFGYAVNQIHCETGCCETTGCCDSDENSNPQSAVLVSSDKCCEVETEKAVIQESALSANVNSNDKLKKETLKSEQGILIEYIKTYTSLTFHKFITSYIYLLVLNLRV